LARSWTPSAASPARATQSRAQLPAVRAYLRIIYEPDYDRPENIERLQKRGLGLKRQMAIRETGVGLEAIHRFIGHAPRKQVHQCVVGSLAMESEPVDPRL
jgi:protein phosphatase